MAVHQICRRSFGWLAVLQTSNKQSWNPLRYFTNLDEERAWRKKYMTSMLACSEKETLDFLNSNNNVVTMRRTKFKKLIDLFSTNSISGQDVLTYPDIFKRKYETVKSRIMSLKLNTDQKNVRLWMINVTNKVFNHRYQIYVEDTHVREEFHDKECLLVNYLDSSKSEATKLLNSSELLQNSKLGTIQKKLELYLAADPNLKAVILDKLWLLTYPLADIEAKMKDIQERNIPSFIWHRSLSMLMKKSGDEYKSLLDRMVKDSAIIGGCSTKEEYICKQLDCDSRVLAIMVKKYNFLLSVKIAKLQSHLKFLQEECGFSNVEIIEYPRVFKFSLEILQQRFSELRQFGEDVPALRLMTQDGKRYTAIIKILNESQV